jgi:hypothetical protein
LISLSCFSLLYGSPACNLWICIVHIVKRSRRLCPGCHKVPRALSDQLD